MVSRRHHWRCLYRVILGKHLDLYSYLAVTQDVIQTAAAEVVQSKTYTAALIAVFCRAALRTMIAMIAMLLLL
jgi:hypothetical protein